MLSSMSAVSLYVVGSLAFGRDHVDPLDRLRVCVYTSLKSTVYQYGIS